MKLFTEILIKSIVFFLICANPVFAQKDSPIKSGIDSARSVSWREMPMMFPSGEPSVIRVETPLVTSDLIVFMLCRDSSYYTDYFSKLPDHCNAFYHSNVNKMNNDTLNKMYFKCIHDYYYNPTTHAKIDTVYLYDEYSLPTSKFFLIDESDDYFMSSVDWKSLDGSTWMHNEYYPLDEIKNECWQGTPFRLKFQENWTNGKKDDRWTYNDIHGEETIEIKYEMGKLVSYKTFKSGHKYNEYEVFEFPDPSGFFSDFEKVLTEKQGIQLNEMLTQFEKESSVEIAVVSIDTYAPYPSLFDYSLDLANTWEVGKPEKDNGIVIVFSKNMREYRVQVGTGLTQKLTDEECTAIFNTFVVPDFKADHYYEGLEKGIRKIMEETR